MLISPIMSTDGKTLGDCNINYEKEARKNDLWELKPACFNLEDVEWFSKTDPLLRFFRPINCENIKDYANVEEVDPKNWYCFYETEPKMNTINPIFSSFKLSGYEICKNNHKLPIKVQLLDFEINANHRVLAETVFYLHELKTSERFHWKFLDKNMKKMGYLEFKTMKFNPWIVRFFFYNLMVFF